MTPIEVIAAVAGFLIISKLIFWLCCPRVLIDWGKAMLKQPEMLLVVYGVLAVILSYFVFQAVGIVPFMACAFLTSVLIKLSYVPYFNSFSKVLGEFPKETGQVFAKSWLAILIWLFLAGWALFAVFG